MNDLDELDRYFAAMASGGARVLSNATQARKVIGRLRTATPVQLDAAQPVVELPDVPPLPSETALPSPVKLPGA